MYVLKYTEIVYICTHYKCVCVCINSKEIKWHWGQGTWRWFYQRLYYACVHSVHRTTLGYEESVNKTQTRGVRALIFRGHEEKRVPICLKRVGLGHLVRNGGLLLGSSQSEDFWIVWEKNLISTESYHKSIRICSLRVHGSVFLYPGLP